LAGNVQVDIDHLGNFLDPAFQGENAVSNDKHLESWKKYAAASQKHGSPTIVQISHPGKQSLRGAGRRGLFASTMAPSAIR
jgi:NADH:flavin oxidoreductases, Old Yellow Enzyme family